MCADKLRKVAPLEITYSDGEQPTASKLNAMSSQARDGLFVTEYAIGDPWNQSGDAFTVGTPLQIPNLARLLGENKYLNPAIYPGTEIFEFHDAVGERYENLTTGYLKFKPSSSATYTGTGAFGTEQTNEYDVSATGEFWVDEATGRFRTYDNVGSSDTLSYEVDPDTDWVAGTETLPGVIPDPRQVTTFTGCRVELVSGSTYNLHLPPRQPLTLDSRETPDNYPSAAELLTNALDTSVQSPPSYWQDDSGTTDALADKHYRYRLPKEILDLYSSKSEGAEYPRGSMYLWDQNTSSIIDGVIFSRPPDTEDEYVIRMDTSDATYTFSTTGSDAEANYSSTGISLITCGSPVARSIWHLLSSFTKHSHRNDGTFEGTVSHNDLTDQNPPDANYTGNSHNTLYPVSNALPPWVPSNWANDPHSSLLSRAGTRDSSRERDVYKNAMLGHLLLANADTSSGNYTFLDEDCTHGSFKIFFGDTSGSSLHVDATNGLTATAMTGSNWHGLAVLSADSTKGLYVNNRVGVGTTSPKGNLHVSSGDTGITPNAGANDLIIETTLQNSGLSFLSDNSLDTEIQYIAFGDTEDSAIGRIFYGHATDNLIFWSNGAETLRMDENNRVGIGVTDPQAGLHISGHDYPLILDSTGDTVDKRRWRFDINGQELRLQSITDSNVFSEGVMTWDHDGNVGIGESSSLGKLHVKTSDAGTISPNTGGDELVLENSGQCGMTIYSGTGNEGSIFFGDSGSDTVGRVVYDHSSDTLNIEAGSIIHFGSAGDGWEIDSNYDLKAIGEHQILADDSSSGASTPAYSFSGNANTGMFQAAANSIGFSTNGTEEWRINGIGDLSSRDSGVILTGVGSAGLPGYAFYGDADTGMFQSDTNEIGFSTAGSEVATIKETAVNLVPASEPTGAKGDLYVNTVTGLPRFHDGSQFASSSGTIQLLVDLTDEVTNWTAATEQIFQDDSTSDQTSVFIPASVLAEARMIEFKAFIGFFRNSAATIPVTRVRLREGTEALGSGEVIGQQSTSSGTTAEAIFIHEGTIFTPGNSSSEVIAWSTLEQAANIESASPDSSVLAGINGGNPVERWRSSSIDISSGLTLSFTGEADVKTTGAQWKVKYWMVRIT